MVAGMALFTQPIEPLFLKSAIVGCLGGVLYCIRGIYLNKCILDRWDDKWLVWYYLRPVASTLSGVISFILLKAGLLVLDATQGDVTYGYYAVAFIAGYNVDNFLKKMEDIAKTVWGIENSRSKNNDRDTTE